MSKNINQNSGWTKLKTSFLSKFTKWIDPKLQKYRTVEEVKPEVFLPESKEDLIWLMRKIEGRVISKTELGRIFESLASSEKKVKDIMTWREELILVNEDELLGPLMLDRLYRSGSTYFLVIDAQKNVVGVLNTRLMNRLEIKETDQAKNYLDEKVYFLREDYGLVSAMQAVVRTGCCFFAVVSLSGKIVGTLTIRELFEVVAGKLSEEEFDDDNRIAAVVKRILK